MTTNIGSSTSYQLTVPSLSETADIQVALKLLSYGSSSDPANDAAIGANSLAGYIKTKSPINNPVFTGTVTLPTGTSSVAPLTFVSGTNLTNISAGTLEYDGKVFYGTPKVNNTTAGRGIIPTEQIFINSSNITKTNSVTGSTASEPSYYLLDKGIYAAANTSYFVEFSVRMSLTCLTATTSPSASNIKVFFAGPTGVSVALDTSYSSFYVSDTSTTTIYSGVRGSNLTTTYVVKGSGIVSTSSTAGNIGPKISLYARGADTGGPDGGASTSSSSFTAYSNSYVKITPIGTSGADINVGGWA